MVLRVLTFTTALSNDNDTSNTHSTATMNNVDNAILIPPSYHPNPNATKRQVIAKIILPLKYFISKRIVINKSSLS